MKILLISPLPPPSGGLASWTRDYLTYAKSAGHSVRVVNTAQTGRHAIRTTRGRSVTQDIRRAFRIISDVRRVLKEDSFDVVHLNTSCAPKGLIRDHICAFLCRKYPIILQCHCNVKDWISGRRISVFLLRFMIRYASQVLVLNRGTRDYLADRFGCDAHIVPNFAVGNAQPFTVRDTCKRVLYVGHIMPSKGAKELFSVASRCPEQEFFLYGPALLEIQNQERPANLRLMGETPHEQVLQALYEADIFLFPSHSEGFSVSLLEAMQAGLPCIATDVGTNADMLGEDGGAVVPVGDVDGMCTALKAMASADVRRKMSVRNRRIVAEKYGIDAVMNELFTIYERVRK